MFFQDKSSGDCSSCRFWYSRPDWAGAYKNVEIHYPPLNLGEYLDELGECRRGAPSAHVTICGSTEEERDAHRKAYVSHEDDYQRAEERWEKRHEDELKAAEARLERIKESLETCQEASTSHWEAELAKQETKIESLLGEQWPSDSWESHHPEPELKTFKALRGVWPLTASDEFCGEWQQR